MILIPIGHEQEGTRRLPVVTFAILGMCVVAFFLSSFGGSRTESETTDAYRKAVEYWMEHPYLNLDPKVGDTTQAFREGLRTMAGDRPDPAEIDRQQVELDRLTREALATAPEHPLQRYGLVPAHLSLVTLFTHMFLHAGWLHLLGNLLILYLAGPFLEDVWGRPIYGAFYLVGGLVAALAFALPHADSAVPLVGASGAIAAVMGAFAVRFAKTKIHMFYMWGFWRRGTFWAPAWIMLGLWFGEQAIYAAIGEAYGSGGDGGVAFLAHVGGFLFGVAVAVAMKRLRVEEEHLGPKLEAKSAKTVLQNAEVAAALEAAAAGNPEGAFERLAAEVRRAPGNVDAAVGYWTVAGTLGREREAAPALARIVQEELRHGQIDLAIDHWNELRARVPGASVEVAALTRISAELVRRADRQGAAAALRAALAGAAKAPSLAVLKIALAAAEVDVAVARGAVTLALARPDLDAESRRQAEALAARVRPRPVRAS